MPDFTSFFAEAFNKYDRITGGGKNPSANVDINNLRPSQSMPGDDDRLQRSYEKSLHPEDSGYVKYKAKKDKEAFYKSILTSITLEEFDNLKHLISAGGYLVLTTESLKSMGEEGEVLHTDRLEQWGLMKRDKIEDGLIQFTIKSMGRQVVRDMQRLIEK